jgi:hypothetical protein
MVCLQSSGHSQPNIYPTAAGPDPTLAEQLSAQPLRDRGIIPLPPSGPELSSQTDEAQPSLQLTSWDGFPDGHFRCHFTPQQIEDTSRLAVYWVSDRLAGGKRGSPDAATPEKGKSSHFKCAGVIHCEATICTVRIAPGTNIARQTEASCSCGSPLHHHSCSVEWSVIFYRDGAVFENSGTHSHSTYTHSL